MSTKKTIIFGGTGFIGHTLALAMSERCDRNIICIGRNRLINKIDARNVSYIFNDINNTNFLEEILSGADEVVDLVYSTNPKTSFDDPVADIVKNLPANVNLLTAVSKYSKAKILIVSSGGTVYGNVKSCPIDEGHATNPISPYGITKLAIEKYALMYMHLSNLKPIIVRPGNPFGPRQSADKSQGFIAAAMKAIFYNTPIKIYGEIGTVRDYIYIDDLVSGIIASLDYGKPGEIYNIGTCVGSSNLDIVNLIIKISQRYNYNAIKTEGKRLFDVESNILSFDKLHSASAWKPTTTLEDGLKIMWNSLNY